MFPPAIDIISTSLAAAYSDGKYTNEKLKRHHVTYSSTMSVFLLPLAGHGGSLASVSKFYVVYIFECLVLSRIVPGRSSVPQDYDAGGFMSL